MRYGDNVRENITHSVMHETGDNRLGPPAAGLRSALRRTRRERNAGRGVGGIAVAAALSLATVGTLALSSPAYAAGLTNINLAVSNNTIKSTGVTYTWNFTTATLGTPDSLTFTVPTGTTGSSLTLTAYGLTGCTVGTPTLASDVVTVSLSGGCPLPATTPVSVAISGFTNTATPTTAFTSDLKVLNGVTELASGTAGVNFASDTTAVTVVVPQSLTFTNDRTAIDLLPIPGAATPATAPVTLTVATNAVSGYELSGCVETDIIGPGSKTIAQAAKADATTLDTFDGSKTLFGAQAAVALVPTTGEVGTGTPSRSGKWASASGNDYVGYPASCGDSTAEISKNTGTTSGDKLTLTNAVSASAVLPAGKYLGTIKYQVTPHY